MRYCCGLRSSDDNTFLCTSNDELGLCRGSDSNGLCSLEAFDVGNAAEFQAKVLDSLGAGNYFNNGNGVGCLKTDTVPPVYAYYCCSKDAAADCSDCYANAVKLLKDGCSGRSGGNVLFDKCSMRYEISNFWRRE
ncbi:unnamed protein product [Linum trigynum]|uniref:Gnk2-homologous domain-containing protein n=1 Tax=Linum trigynum TaxID=586398 RepID=A0AAV2F2A7_9ROSI